MKIYITGCAKSGTTLLRRLFNAFDGVEVIAQETRLEDFVQMVSNAPVLVAKRSADTVFSNCLFRDDLARQLRLILQHNIQVVNILRRGDDVVESGYVHPARWLCSINSYLAHRLEYIAATVRYERLVTEPDAVQEDLAYSLALGIKHRFSEYPAFITNEPVLQPITSARVNKGFEAPMLKSALEWYPR